MKLGGIYLSVGAKTTNLKRDLKKAEGITKKSAVLMQQEIGRISFVHVGVAAAAFSAAFVVGMKKSIDAASDLQEVTGKFNVVFDTQIVKAEQMAKVLVDSYAMSTREAKEYMSSVQDLLVPMGMASDEALNMSDSVVKLAADLGSFNNLPTAQVMGDIQSALVGNFETMKKYGVVLNETVTKEKARSMGLYEGKGALDANIKAQVAFQLMMEGSSAAIGDQARTMGSYANQVKLLKAQFEDIGAAIGSQLLPQMTAFVDLLNKLIQTNPQVIEQIGQFAKNVLDLAAALGSAVYSGIEYYNVWVKTIQALGLASGGVITLKEALTNGVEAVNKFETEIGRTELAIGKLDAEIQELQDHIDMSVEFGQTDEAAIKFQATLIRQRDALQGVAEELERQNAAGRQYLEIQGKSVTVAEDQAKALNKVEVAAKKTGERVGWMGFRAKESWEIFAKGAEEANQRTTEMFESIDAELETFFEDIDAGTVQMTEGFSEFYGVTMAMQMTFSDTLKGEFDSIGDAFKDLMTNMVSAFLSALAQMAAEWLAKQAMGLFSGGVGGGGGAAKNSGPVSGLVSKIPVVGGVLGGIASVFGFQEGGMIPSKGYASGGVLSGGSGYRDDLFMGRVGGSNIFAQGGEYITNEKSTSANLGNLEAINNQGGIAPSIININIGGHTIESLVLEVVDGHIVERNARGLTTGESILMLLVTLTIAAATRRVSNEELALTNSWYAEIISAPTITKATAKDYGGYVKMRWGDISFMPTTFIETTWPPPRTVAITVQWTATTEAAATTLFTGTLHRKQVKRDAVTYSMYATEYDTSVDDEAFTGALIAEFTGVCTDLSLTLDSTDARVVADTDYTASGILVDLASNLAAYFSHFFYISGTTLYLVDMLDSLTEHTFTEFDYEPVVYTDQPPYSRIEDGTFGIDGTYTYGGTLSVSPNCESVEADAETALGNVKTIMEMPRITLSCPISAETVAVVIGDKINFDNSIQNLSGWLRVRSIQYNFNRGFVTFNGEGTIA